MRLEGMHKTTPSEARSDALPRFLHALLDQALALAAAHEAPGAPPYQRPVGAHLRHVIEHIESLLDARGAATLDYDDRPRDLLLECEPRFARERLRMLQQRLAALRGDDLERPLRLSGRAGLAGELAFEVSSTLGRELAFVASHTVHHYALLVAHCARRGLPLPADFGKAPATVAHERSLVPSHSQPAQEAFA